MESSLGFEARISNMNLSPTSSPRRRTTFVEVSGQRPSRQQTNRSYTSPAKDYENLTPLRQQPPLSSTYNPAYMSPRPPPTQAFIRTHSSPSLIDASPKMKVKGPACHVAITPSPSSLGPFAPHPTSRLTPIASNVNTGEPHTHSHPSGGSNHYSMLEDMAVPERRSLKSAFRTNSQRMLLSQAAQGRPNSMILPRHDNIQSNGYQRAELRPVSPPSWSSRAPSDDQQEQRHESPLPGAIHLERSCRSLIGSSGHRMPEPLSVPSSPVNERGEEMTPYEPERDSRLAAFGIVRDDADSIFLSAPVDTRRSGQQTSEGDDMIDDTDLSVPSIHLGTNLQLTNSFATISGEELDSSMESESQSVVQSEHTNASYMLPQWGCFPQMNIAQVLSPQRLVRGNGILNSMNINASTATNRNNATSASANANTRTTTSAEKPSSKTSRYMSPEKEREVFDWLHSLEIDKDNDYIAEAASSKFLTGKLVVNDLEHSTHSSSVGSVAPYLLQNKTQIGNDELMKSAHSCALEPEPSLLTRQKAFEEKDEIVINARAMEMQMQMQMSLAFVKADAMANANAIKKESEKPSRLVMGRRVDLRPTRTTSGRRILRSSRAM